MTSPALTHYELDTTPFTTLEREAIAAYEQATAGIPDALDVVGGYYDEDADPATVADTARHLFTLLREWYTALDALYSGLRNPGEGPAFSEAAHRFLREQCTAWYHTLNVVRRETCRALVGTAGPCPEVDAGTMTFFDIPGVELDGRIAAESR